MYLRRYRTSVNAGGIKATAADAVLFTTTTRTDHHHRCHNHPLPSPLPPPPPPSKTTPPPQTHLRLLQIPTGCWTIASVLTPPHMTAPHPQSHTRAMLYSLPNREGLQVANGSHTVTQRGVKWWWRWWWWSKCSIPIKLQTSDARAVISHHLLTPAFCNTATAVHKDPVFDMTHQPACH